MPSSVARNKVFRDTEVHTELLANHLHGFSDADAFNSQRSNDGVYGFNVDWFLHGLTPKLTGAVARSAEGTDTGHDNGEAMACVGVRVERPVRLESGVEGR